MTYPQAIQFLYDLRLFGAKLGLENTLKLAELAGNPQGKLRFIHVAGTNGKGSTCAMLESVYRQAGLRVGLFTSPHLVSFAERIQVNRQLIGEADVARLAEETRLWLKSFPAEVHPTFFEVVTVMALKYFAEQRCDLVILETGMGGRLDATNIVTPLASVITNVQFDHQQWLGNSLTQIAAEKAGIIKPRIPVITGTDDAPALEVIASAARAKAAPLTVVTDAQARAARKLELPLLGDHQRLNAALALATIEVLREVLPIKQDLVERGLKAVQWAGRLQLVKREAGRIILLDGAHNPAGAQTLAAALGACFPGTRPALILGAMRDKDWPAMCHILAPMASTIHLCPTGSDRSADPQRLVAACQEANKTAPIFVCSGLAEALKSVAAEPFTTVAGSLHMIGEAMELLHLSPAVAERGLNEWTTGIPK
jgi:dihydrofolate synthase/folylpolyglutamate synthase